MNPFRTASLAIVCVALTTVTAQTALQPQAKQPIYKSFSFPDTVPIQQWQPVTEPNQNSLADKPNNRLFSQVSDTDLISTDLTSTETFSGEIAAHKQYQYQQNNHTLTIDIRYLVNTNGNLKGLFTELISDQTSQTSLHIKQNAEQDAYSLTTYQGYAYLNACQNARGSATITTDQFNRNRLIHDLRPTRLLPWLQGKDTLPDQRCLWTQLAVPIADYGSEAKAYEAIETIWIAWGNGWQPNFPSL